MERRSGRAVHREEAAATWLQGARLLQYQGAGQGGWNRVTRSQVTEELLRPRTEFGLYSKSEGKPREGLRP